MELVGMNKPADIAKSAPERWAIWERFRPVQENAEDWQTYCSFRGEASDTLSKRTRFLSLAQLVRRVAAAGIQGAVAECGCFTGHSTHVIARTMTLCGIASPLHVFDSFEGLSAPTNADMITSDRHTNPSAVNTILRTTEKMFASDLSTTMANLSEHKFIVFNPGWIPESFAGMEDEHYAFVHIDVDLYEPTRDCLDFFYPRLNRGGVIQIDDYNFMDWPGSQKAVDEFLAREKPSFFFELPLGGAFMVK
ncbi:MAG: class I SAM-dependent methyltransferase [Rhodobacteraceae bacterium]|nr:class I SAM-dependent methyltransferase [Paracoccaceae bacterium]